MSGDHYLYVLMLRMIIRYYNVDDAPSRSFFITFSVAILRRAICP